MSDQDIPLDPGRVDLVDPAEREHWRREFGCSDEALEAAVAAVGTHTTQVRAYLEQQQRTGRPGRG